MHAGSAGHAGHGVARDEGVDGYANVLSSQMDSDLVDEERAVDIGHAALRAGDPLYTDDHPDH